MGSIRSLVAALVASCLMAAPALGNDIKGTLNEFGLAGAWSSDCSGASIRTARFTFAVPAAGEASATAIDNNNGELTTTDYAILEAVMVANDKIGIALHPVAVTHSDGQTASQREYNDMHLVFQKAGARIQVIRVQYEGLPEIEWSRFFEKCAK